MVFYIDAKSDDIFDYLSENGEFIGTLGSTTSQNITPNDISIDKINEKLKEDKFLVCAIMVSTWWVCVLFNNADGANEIKRKYKGKLMSWFWLSRENLKFCMHKLQYKEFLKEFPESNKNK